MDASLAPKVPDVAAAQARVRDGIPALEGEPLLDGEGLRRNMRILGERIGALDGAAIDARAVAGAFERGVAQFDAEALARAAVAGAWDEIVLLAPRFGLDDYSLVVMLDYAARPALRAAAARVREATRTTAWERGICPACGAQPLLAELRAPADGGNGARERVLRCGRCASAWSFPRVGCPRCGERSHAQLGYLHHEGDEEFCRADCCESCGCYVKAIAVHAPLGADELLERDLATAGLDWVAVERGYHR
jgi:FdhE protein